MTFEDRFLGFDLSTQQLKVIVTNAKLQAEKIYHVEFDAVYKKKYNIAKGVRSDDASGEIVSPVFMWLDALDHVFQEMKDDGFDFATVKGLCGLGMQHGSVFWSKLASQALADMSQHSSLAEALEKAFACDTSPNWQDHSTGQEIKDFEKVAHGPEELAKITGSRAHYRFTGLQIRKLAKRSGIDLYRATDRISLVSSFLASVLQGLICAIEEADGCGMNIYDIEKGAYDDTLLAVAAAVHPDLDGVSEDELKAGVKELKRKLGDLNPVSYNSTGTISQYFVDKYGFSTEAKVYSFTGDNLATVISLPLQQNDVLISLGTSTTVLVVTENYSPSSQYHLFKHPTIKDAYMGMICYCNGALAREKVRDALNEKHQCEEGSWDKFNGILDNSSKFDNRLGIYFPLGEIVPNASKQTKRSKANAGRVEDVEEWDVELDVTSIVESQTVSCRVRAGPMLCSSGSSEATPETESGSNKKLLEDLHSEYGQISTDGKLQTDQALVARPRKIYFVGGASRNKSIIAKMASIMGATDGNYQVEIPNACALGGAFKASWSYECETLSKWIDFNSYLNANFDFGDVEKFDVQDHWADYFPAIGLLSKMEAELKHD